MSNENVTIGVCGAPLAGKATLLGAISKRLKASPPVESFEATDRLRSFETPERSRQWRFLCSTGPVFYERKVIQHILSEAQIVCYVFASVGASGDAIREDEDFQLERFHLHKSVSVDIGRDWTKVPWIFVFNKKDLGSDNPFLPHVPKDFRSGCVMTSAIDGKGIGALLQQIEHALR